MEGLAPGVKLISATVYKPNGEEILVAGDNVLALDSPKGLIIAKDSDGNIHEWWGLPFVVVSQRSAIIAPPAGPIPPLRSLQ